MVEADNRNEGLIVLWKSHLNWEVCYKYDWIMGFKIPDVDIGFWTLWVCHCLGERNGNGLPI